MARREDRVDSVGRGMKPFLTDESIAERLRAIEARLRAADFPNLAEEVASLAWGLEPETPEAQR